MLVWWLDGNSATHWNCNRVIRPARYETSYPLINLSYQKGHFPGLFFIMGMSPIKRL